MMGNSMPNRVHNGVCSMMYLLEKRRRAGDDGLWQTDFQQNRHLTPGLSRCRKPKRGTSGGWRQSAAGQCYAAILYTFRPQYRRCCEAPSILDAVETWYR